MGHTINFSSIAKLDKTLGYMNHLIKRVIEMRLHPKNLMVAGVSISVSPGIW
jgi:hypothetical protein